MNWEPKKKEQWICSIVIRFMVHPHYHDVIIVVMVMMVPDKSDQKFKVQHACGLGIRYMEQESV